MLALGMILNSDQAHQTNDSSETMNHRAGWWLTKAYSKVETFLRARRNRQKQQQQKREEGIEIEFDKKID